MLFFLAGGGGTHGCHLSSKRPSPWSPFGSGHPAVVTSSYHCPPTLTASLRAPRTCNWKLLPLLPPPRPPSPPARTPVTCRPGITSQACTVTLPTGMPACCLRFTPTLGPQRAPGGRSRPACAWEHIKAQESPGRAGSTSSRSPTPGAGPHTRHRGRPQGLKHHDIYAPGGNSRHSCAVRQSWGSVRASVSDTC